MRQVPFKKVYFEFDYNKLSTRKKTNQIVIHHTGTPQDTDLGVAAINNMHQANGWVCIGYHYIIRKDGTIEVGRPHWTVGAHAQGRNWDTIGIHLSGNFEIAEPTKLQIESLALLTASLCQDYSLPIDAKHIVGHRDLMATSCPGKNLYNSLDLVIKKALWYKFN